MKDISEEGVNFKYILPECEPEYTEEREKLIGRFALTAQVEELLKTGPHTRLALFESCLPDHGNELHVLLFKTHVDLLDLDDKVRQGVDLSGCFQDSIRANFRVSFCTWCGWEGPTIIADPGSPYPGQPRLLISKERQFPQQLCPDCGESFRSYVLKVLPTEFT